MENEETTADVTEQEVDTQDEQTTNDDTNEAVEDSTETQEEAPAGDTDDDEEEEQQPQQRYQTQQPQMIDFSRLPTNDQGEIDPNAFSQAMAQMQQQTIMQAREQARAEMMELRQEETMWQKAEKAYPQIATNPELRNLVQNTRYGIIASGKNASPLQAARQIFKHLGTARQEGQTQAKESVRIQRSGQLETSSTKAAPKSPSSDLMGKITSRNRVEAEGARQALLQQWIADGTIKTR